VLGNCGLTNQVAGARSPAMTWVEGFDWFYSRAREEMVGKHWR